MAMDIDRIVNYEREYMSRLQKCEKKGQSLMALCPFHRDEKSKSLSVNLKTGQFKCFGCGEEGNFVSFLSKYDGISTGDAYKRICEAYGIEEDRRGPRGYTVEEYASEKGLSASLLKDTLHLTAVTEKGGWGYVKFPYFDEHGKQTIFRKRYPKGAPQKFKWSNGSRGKMQFYGLQFLGRIEEQGRCLLVEGESDTQALYDMHLPALGVPGATMWNAIGVHRLKNVGAIYLHVEPDTGGKTFRQMGISALKAAGFAGQVYTWSCSAAGYKDPSDLYKAKQAEAQKIIEDLLSQATLVDIYAAPEAIKGAPVNLRQPEGWFYSEDGIFQIDERQSEPALVCRTPILITRRLRIVGALEEKVEISFLRDGTWHAASFERSVVFQAKSVVRLSDLGCMITSENAKGVVRFLQALEQANFDIIEAVSAARTMGWQDAKRFLPFNGEGIALDIDPSMRGKAEAYAKNGSLDGWRDQMRPLRERSNLFRFITSAALASPILRTLSQRVFFIYNWGDSRAGKTAATKAALSAWGDPGGLMTTFNATAVGLERLAGLYCDLPLGIDERQLAGSKQEQLEKIVYMLGSGQGKLRGAKMGGLQDATVWRSVILASGEEPIIKTATQGGVTTRTLELYGSPFRDEQDARFCHMHCTDNMGWAGDAIVRAYLDAGQQEIHRVFDEISAVIERESGAENGSHVTAVATVATADYFAGVSIFGESKEHALLDAEVMGIQILAELAESAGSDVNENAMCFVRDWVMMHPANFDARNNVPQFGFFTDSRVCIIPSAIQEALTSAGFDHKKTMMALIKAGVLQTDKDRKRFTKKIKQSSMTGKGTAARMIVLSRSFVDGEEQVSLEALETGPEW